MPCKPPRTASNNPAAVFFMDLQHKGGNIGPSWDKATNLVQPVDSPSCLPSNTALDGQKGTIKMVSGLKMWLCEMNKFWLNVVC